jgi:hypothetical protein
MCQTLHFDLLNLLVTHDSLLLLSPVHSKTLSFERYYADITSASHPSQENALISIPEEDLSVIAINPLYAKKEQTRTVALNALDKEIGSCMLPIY